MSNYLGFRWWKVIRDDTFGLRLRSVYYEYDWNLAGPSRATHGPRQSYYREDPPHDAPAYDCECGFYVFRSLPVAVVGDYGGGTITRNSGEDHCTVLGAVVTGGHVVFHGDQGIRAAQARPVALAVQNREDTHPLVAALADRLAVPVFTIDNLEKWAGEFGDRQPAA